MKLKQKDLMLLSQLRQDARAKLTRMSRETKIPVSTLFKKIRSYRKLGIVKKFTILFDLRKLGYKCKALALLKVDHKDRDALGCFLCQNQNVNTLLKINSGWNYFLELIFQEMKEAESFLEELENKFGIKKKKVLYVIDEEKRETFKPDQLNPRM